MLSDFATLLRHNTTKMLPTPGLQYDMKRSFLGGNVRGSGVACTYYGYPQYLMGHLQWWTYYDVSSWQ